MNNKDVFVSGALSFIISVVYLISLGATKEQTVLMYVICLHLFIYINSRGE